MADSAINILDSVSAAKPVDTRTNASGDHMQTVVIGTDGANTTAPLNSSGGLSVQPTPFTSGGNSQFHMVSDATDNVNIKASAGQLYGVVVSNRAPYPIYVKFHNTSGTPTIGSGVVRTVGVKEDSDVNISFPYGIVFTTGIGISIVQGIADNDTTAVAANDCVVDVEYK